MNTQQSNSILFFFLLSLVIISSCSEDDTGIDKTNDTTDITGQVIENPEYEPTQLSEDTTNLFIEQGNKESDTVWIYEQGGPGITFPDDNLKFLPNNHKYHHIHAHQAQDYNTTLYTYNITKEDAIIETNTSIEILKRIVHYFKSRGKMVVVIGNSYGSWIVLRYLSQYGSETADKFVIMAGRLDMDYAFYSGFLQYKGMHFPDYITAVVGGQQPRAGHKGDRLEMLLIGVICSDRNTEQLKDVDLTNMLIAYSKDDPLVGRLKEHELQFLTSKKATIIHADGGHGGMWHEPYNEDVYNFIVK